MSDPILPEHEGANEGADDSPTTGQPTTSSPSASVDSEPAESPAIDSTGDAPAPTTPAPGPSAGSFYAPPEGDSKPPKFTPYEPGHPDRAPEPPDRNKQRAAAASSTSPRFTPPKKHTSGRTPQDRRQPWDGSPIPAIQPDPSARAAHPGKQSVESAGAETVPPPVVEPSATGKVASPSKQGSPAFIATPETKPTSVSTSGQLPAIFSDPPLEQRRDFPATPPTITWSNGVKPATRIRVVSAIGAVLLFAGSVLPWAVISGIGGRSGSPLHQALVALAAFLILVCGQAKNLSGSQTLGLISAAVAAIIVIYNMLKISEILGPQARFGVGIWLSLAGLTLYGISFIIDSAADRSRSKSA